MPKQGPREYRTASNAICAPCAPPIGAPLRHLRSDQHGRGVACRVQQQPPRADVAHPFADVSLKMQSEDEASVEHRPARCIGEMFERNCPDERGAGLGKPR